MVLGKNNSIIDKQVAIACQKVKELSKIKKHSNNRWIIKLLNKSILLSYDEYSFEIGVYVSDGENKSPLQLIFDYYNIVGYKGFYQVDIQNPIRTENVVKQMILSITHNLKLIESSDIQELEKYQETREFSYRKIKTC